jgi:hypothetical protein
MHRTRFAPQAVAASRTLFRVRAWAATRWRTDDAGPFDRIILLDRETPKRVHIEPGGLLSDDSFVERKACQEAGVISLTPMQRKPFCSVCRGIDTWTRQIDSTVSSTATTSAFGVSPNSLTKSALSQLVSDWIIEMPLPDLIGFS